MKFLNIWILILIVRSWTGCAYIRAGMSRWYVYGSVTNRETRKIWFCETDVSVGELKEYNVFLLCVIQNTFTLTMTCYRYAPLNDRET
jgi:hypothetical protein